jgi:hypothetical protein
MAQVNKQTNTCKMNTILFLVSVVLVLVTIWYGDAVLFMAATLCLFGSSLLIFTDNKTKSK